MEIVLGLTLLLIALGIIENAWHKRRLRQIPIRIHVNGTRGKSTTTRLIAGLLRKAGYRVLAKTTGTDARLILEDGSEIPIKRRHRPSIIEQARIVREAARRGVDALVIECMAVEPEMQWVSEHRILKSTIGVLTNVREDHLDVIGPELQDVAAALANTIPKSAQLVLGEEEFREFFQTRAEELDTSVHLAAGTISAQHLARFPYLMFKENVACALQVGELLGVPENLAWEGMWEALPDPGSTKIYRLQRSGTTIYFVNALAANDATSTLRVWEGWQRLTSQLALRGIPVVGLLHNRADRSFRVPELVRLTCSQLSLDFLWLTGDLVFAAKGLLREQGFDLQAVAARKRARPETVVDDLSGRYQGEVALFAYGNTQGLGQQFIDYFEKNGELMDYVAGHRVRFGS
jgi:poly-gamma-glutamate synthase PgsB/CapB